MWRAQRGPIGCFRCQTRPRAACAGKYPTSRSRSIVGDSFGGAQVKDWASAAKLQAPRGWITAIDGKTGAVRWQYYAESQVQAGLVPTKSGLLFAGDTHGNLLVFDAKNGSLTRSPVKQYVAAAVGGATENPSTVAGPLRVSVYGLHGGDKPKVVTLDRLQLPQTTGRALFGAVCPRMIGTSALNFCPPGRFRKPGQLRPLRPFFFIECKNSRQLRYGSAGSGCSNTSRPFTTMRSTPQYCLI
jgi:hypothetical protein